MPSRLDSDRRRSPASSRTCFCCRNRSSRKKRYTARSGGLIHPLADRFERNAQQFRGIPRLGLAPSRQQQLNLLALGVDGVVPLILVVLQIRVIPDAVRQLTDPITLLQARHQAVGRPVTACPRTAETRRFRDRVRGSPRPIRPNRKKSPTDPTCTSDRRPRAAAGASNAAGGRRRHIEIIVCYALLVTSPRCAQFFAQSCSRSPWPSLRPGGRRSHSRRGRSSSSSRIDGWRWDYIERFATARAQHAGASRRQGRGAHPDLPVEDVPESLHDRHRAARRAPWHRRRTTWSTRRCLGDSRSSNRDVQQDTRWWGGEPLWVTASGRARLRPRCSGRARMSRLPDDRPTYWRPYDTSYRTRARVDQLLAWLKRAEPKRPTFLTLYFSDVDTAGHRSGPTPRRRGAPRSTSTACIGRLIAASSGSAWGRAPTTSSSATMAWSRCHAIASSCSTTISTCTTVDLIDSAPIVGHQHRARASRRKQIYRALNGKHPRSRSTRAATLPRTTSPARSPTRAGCHRHRRRRVASDHAGLAGARETAGRLLGRQPRLRAKASFDARSVRRHRPAVQERTWSCRRSRTSTSTNCSAGCWA